MSLYTKTDSETDIVRQTEGGRQTDRENREVERERMSELEETFR